MFVPLLPPQPQAIADTAAATRPTRILEAIAVLLKKAEACP